MLGEAGIGFGEVTTTFLQKALKRLAKISGASKLQFFGKIMATSKDYWVISGTLTEQEESPSNALQEARGVGANSTVFWVTNNVVTGDWVQLPDIQPHHIEAASKIKKLLTGNLQA
jgi:hypothetical protein